MRTHRDARLDSLLDAICAVASSLPSETRQRAATALGARMAGQSLPDEACNTAVAADLAHVLRTLECMPAIAWPAGEPSPGDYCSDLPSSLDCDVAAVHARGRGWSNSP